MRIALVIKTNSGGLWALPQVQELRSRGHDVTVLLPAGDGRLRRALDAQHVPVVESGFSFHFHPRLATLSGLLRLRRQLITLNPDVIFYHLYASALAARFASTGMRVSRVHMVAGPLYLESPIIRMAERLLAKLDTVTICGSEFTARAYRNLDRPREATPAIPYGVDTKRFRMTDTTIARDVRTELGISDSAFVVVMVAFVYAPKRAVHHRHGIKGHSVLLDAWSIFHRMHPECHLVIVGSGIDEAAERYRRSLMARHGLPDQTRKISWVSTADDVQRYYAAADLSVSPSLSENHGAALEAGAMSVPSIVSDAGALPETIGPECGWVVPRGNRDALVAALETAHSEFAEGVLRGRGLRARQFMVQAFDSTLSSMRVADVIELAGRCGGWPRTYSVFCETRIDYGVDGGLPDTGNASPWARYLRDGNRLKVVVRAEVRRGRRVTPLVDRVRVVPLPYYVGVRQLVAKAVPLAVSIARAVRDAQVIIVRLPGPVGSVAAVMCILLRRRYGVEVVGDPRDVLAAGVLGRAGQLAACAAAAYTRWAVRRADAVVYVTKDRLQDRYPAARRSMEAGVSDVVLTPEAYLPRPRRWARGRARIVAVGSQEQHYKGHDVLLRAVRRLIDGGHDVDAVIVGGGRMHEEIRALATSLGLDDRVTLTGAIDDRVRLVEVLDSASVFAMPSRTEGLPRALIEAMARGLPAVGTDVGGIPELLESRWIVPPGDDHALAGAVVELLVDPDLWEAQSKRNLVVARGYGVEDLGTQFEAWLQRVPNATADAWSSL